MKNPILELISPADAAGQGRKPSAGPEAVRNEELFRLLAENSSDMILHVSLTPTPRLVYVNPACYAMTGYRQRDFYKFTALPGDTADERPAQFRELMHPDDGDDDEPVEFRWTRRDGSILWMEQTRTVVRDRRGRVTDIYFICRDITRRKAAEETLQESRNFMSNLLSHAPHGMLVINPDTSIRYVNPAWENSNGWTMDEVAGMKAPYPWWPEEMREDLDTWFENTVAAGTGYREVMTVRKDGRRCWQATNWVAVRENGELQYLLINLVDITKRKMAEQALRESEEKFSRAFQTSPQIMSIITLDGVFLDVNEAFIRSAGYRREEIIGRSIEELEFRVGPADRARLGKKLQKHGKVTGELCRLRAKSGDPQTLLLSMEKVTLLGETCLLVAGTDITQRIAMENALRESEQKYAAAFRSSPDPMCLVSIEDSAYVDVNDSYAYFTGYRREELIGKTENEINLWVYPQERDRMLKLLDTDGCCRHQEFSFRMKSGDIRIWLCSADIIKVNGRPYMLAVATDITARKEAEQALLESEERFNTAFNASPGSISISRVSDGRLIEVNESFLRDKGYTREEVIGRTVPELGLWKSRESRQYILGLLREKGRVHNELVEYMTKSGQVKTGYHSAATITFGGEPCIIMHSTDITRQREAEEKLRLLGSITEHVSDSTVVTDADLKITYLNQTAIDLFGYSLEEARGHDIAIFDEKPMGKRTKNAVMKRLSAGKPWCGIVRKRRKDGSVIICQCRTSPLLDEQGNVVSYIDIQHDITEQKETEAKLHINRQLVDSILASMPEGVLVTDRQDNVVLANKAFHRIFNIRKRSVVNRRLKELLPVGQLTATYQVVKMNKLPEATIEFRYQAADAEKIIAAVITHMDDERTLLTFTDVSRDREEEEKLYLTDRLASIGEMATGLAHELNNPLTSILALTQMLLEGDLPADEHEDLSCVYEEAKRAASIVKNVLLFTRNNNYEHGRSDANEVLKDVLRLREYEESTSNITVVADMENELPDIAIDKYQLQQVFLNMVLNAEAAIKTTDRPGVLTVVTERKNGHVNIVFKDNGCGIKKSVLPRIFDPFFTTKEIGKGTGLGLSICYGITVKHGGKIQVKSQENEGTTFSVTLPVAAGRETAGEAAGVPGKG